MNTGIIMIGLAFILFSVALMVSPSAAAGPDTACRPGCGSAIFIQHQNVEQGYQSAGGDSGETCIPEKTVTGSASLP
jgi:hypothetical protein